MRDWRISGSGIPRRTLSCFSVLWPIKTASPNARCRNKCCLSSRDVKLIGVKSLVVILPSTVMANVTATNGRELLGRRDENESERGRAVAFDPALFLLRFADFMLDGCHLAFHIPELHASAWPAWP